MSFGVRPPRGYIAATIATFCTVMISAPPTFAAPMASGSEQHSTPAIDSPQQSGLTREISQFRSRITLIQAALTQDQPGVPTALQSGGLVVAEMGMSGAGSSPVMDSKAMPMAAGCCAGMMGQMGAAQPAAAMPSALPGFPGASHLYHVGATGFFLDYSAALKLTTNQQAALNAIKEKSIASQASAQRQIDQAEQELWILTSSDQPDSLALEAKVREIENLQGEQRIAFIRAVGEAARMLTDDQRAALLGTAPVATEALAPQGPTGAVNSPTGAGATDPKPQMPATALDSMDNMDTGETQKPMGPGGMGDM